MSTTLIDGRNIGQAVQFLTDLVTVMQARLDAARDSVLRESTEEKITVAINHAHEMLSTSPDAVRLVERVARLGRKARVEVELRMAAVHVAAFGGSELLRSGMLSAVRVVPLADAAA